MVDGGSQNLNPSPGGAGSPTGDGGATQGGSRGIPAELRVTAENLGLRLVPEKEYSELERVFGSVKHGNIAEKLKRLDTITAEEEKRALDGKSEAEKAAILANQYRERLELTQSENTEMALRYGILMKNLERSLPGSPKEAVHPKLLDWSVLSEFKGGDEAALDHFVESALDKMAEHQRSLAQFFRPADSTPGGSPVASTAARGDRLTPQKQGSPIKEAFDWRSKVRHYKNPHTELK